MAEMIPRGVTDFKTAGEGIFYKFLESAAGPNERYISWYLPDIDGKEPDFILFSLDAGLLILEVKDWNLEQITELNKRYCKIMKGKKIDQVKNPLQQARDYRDALMEKIKSDGVLVSKKHLGNPKIPIDYGVVFPNMIRRDYMRSGLHIVIPATKIFFWDDIHPDSDLSQDKTGMVIRKFINAMFTLKFPFRIEPKEFNHLKQIIYPEVRIKCPKRKSSIPEGWSEQVRALDNKQEALARKFENKKCLIIGPSGSGKTLVLVHKAAFLKKYNKDVKRILFLCFNITLVNYIKRLLGEQKVGFGDEGVQVYHFFELCSKIIGEDLSYEVDDQEYYECVVSEALERVKESNIRFDAIFVDEGQDLTDAMFEIITALLGQNKNILTIALDESQNVYGRRISWKNLFEDKDVYKLNFAYRNTKEISRFANKLVSDESTIYAGSEEVSLVESFPIFNGPEPVMKKCRNIDECLFYTVSMIQRMLEENEYPLSEIAVIYARTYLDDGTSLPKLLIKNFLSRGIMFKWSSEDYL